MIPRDRERGAFMRNMQINLERQAQLGWNMVVDNQFEVVDIHGAFKVHDVFEIEERKMGG